MNSPTTATPPREPIHIALQFGHVHHWNEGLAEVARQLGLQFAQRAAQLKQDQGVHFHYILPTQWHGMFGPDVQYHALQESMRWRHQFPVDLDVWHGLHQHMRYRPPRNSRHNIITVHDLNHVYAKKGVSLWWQNLRLTRHLRRAHQLVAISQYVADDLAKHLPWAPPAQVIYNGVADLSQSPQLKPPGLALTDYLLHISRMSPSKNAGALIEMAALWPEQPLLLVGPDSAEVSKHKAHVARLGLKNVHFLTDVSEAEKAWLLAHCKAFFFPSLMEGFGLPPIEAMYFGKPVVIAARTSLPEICGEHAGYWQDFEPHHMRTIVEARVLELEKNPSRRMQTQTWARQNTWPPATELYMPSYQESGH
jgi:glycosyltransferase involved in cell wall biosynthesis